MNDPIVAADEVSLTYGAGAVAVRALDRVSLDLFRGEVLLILGPSGSGKTSLLQILGGLIAPTSGSLTVAGMPASSLSAKARRRLRLDYFGFIFQAHHLIPTLTAWENVAVALDLKGVRGRTAEARSRFLLDGLGLGSRADAFPSELSGGQRQRVAVARACALDPPVILADEPTASLDSAAGRQVIELLRDLADHQGRAVGIVTHDERWRAHADRIVSIEDGRVAGDAGANLH
jgi:putative ABC transport system ATP-binding protein